LVKVVVVDLIAQGFYRWSTTTPYYGTISESFCITPEEMRYRIRFLTVFFLIKFLDNL